MSNEKSFFSKPFLGVLTLSLLPLILEPLLHYLAVAPQGSNGFLWLELFIGLPCLVAAFALLIAPFLLFVERLRLLAARILLASGVLLVSTYLGSSLGYRVRMAAFDRLAERSAPLVAAVRSYEARHGTPPPSLDALVPECFSSVPDTGMGAYPKYEYHVGERAKAHDGNPWVLVVFTPSGGINFDQFMYFPLQNFPERGYGGRLERIRDWAYVHE